MKCHTTSKKRVLPYKDFCCISRVNTANLCLRRSTTTDSYGYSFESQAQRAKNLRANLGGVDGCYSNDCGSVGAHVPCFVHCQRKIAPRNLCQQHSPTPHGHA